MNGMKRTTHLLESQVDRFVEEDLTPAERTAAEGHLWACPTCRGRVAAYRTLFEALDALPVPEPPPGFAARVLAAVRPSEEAMLIRFATRAYAAVAVALAAVAAGILGAEGPGPVVGTLASGLTRTLGDAVTSMQNIVVVSIDVMKAILDLVPLARVMGSLARGLETTALALAPQYFVLTALTLLLATLVLVWATTQRERGVPHVSLSL